MPYVKTNWAQGARLSIERLNKLENGVVELDQKNTANESAMAATTNIITEAGNMVNQINNYNEEGHQILDDNSPPVILSDAWGFFDGADFTSSTASEITRTFSGYVTRLANALLYKNNGSNIEILQPGKYVVIRTARVAASDGYWETLDYGFQPFILGGRGTGYRMLSTISSVDFITVNAGYQIDIRVTLYGGGGLTLSGSNGKIAIQKVE